MSVPKPTPKPPSIKDKNKKPAIADDYRKRILIETIATWENPGHRHKIYIGLRSGAEEVLSYRDMFNLEKAMTRIDSFFDMGD